MHSGGGATMTPEPDAKLSATMSFNADSTPQGPDTRETRSQSPESTETNSDRSEQSSASFQDTASGEERLEDQLVERDHLAFAPVALAQYHNISEKLASNNIFRILRSPAPIRVWVYRSLFAENRLWDEWNRTSRAVTDMERERAHDGSWEDNEELESVGDSEYDVNTVQARPYLTRLRLALAPYTVHFRNPGYMRDETLRMLERDVVKKTLEDSRKRLELREELGLSWEFWDDLAGVLKAAIPSLEKRCFAQPDPAAPEYEGLSGPLIASYSPSLLRDLERLNQLVCISRNVLVHGERVQNLSAERLFDKDIFNLINICVRVTARGYDGEAGTQDEDKWQGVINACKSGAAKLTDTC